MTVGELVSILLDMPQDADVCIEYFDYDNSSMREDFVSNVKTNEYNEVVIG